MAGAVAPVAAWGQGDTAQARQFTPMAIDAYGMAAPLGHDGHEREVAEHAQVHHDRDRQHGDEPRPGRPELHAGRLRLGRRPGPDVDQARAIAAELKKYSATLQRKPRWLLFNKIDAVEDPQARIAKILAALRWKRPWFKVSALTGEGCREVCKAVARELARA